MWTPASGQAIKPRLRESGRTIRQRNRAESLADNGVNVEMISSGASSAAAYFLVRKADVLPAVRALHAEFFEARANRPPNRAG